MAVPLTMNTRDFTQSGRTGAKGKVDIMASGKLTSTGLLVSDDALVLKAQDVTQNGVLSGGKGLTVSAQTLSSGKKIGHPQRCCDDAECDNSGAGRGNQCR